VKNFRILFLLLSIQLILTGAVAANAQNAFNGKFQLSSEVRWGMAVLPAGEYSFVLESTQPPVRIVIHSADGKTRAMAVARATADARPGVSYLFITENSSGRIVRSLNLPQLGTSLIYEPLTQRERERLYASQAHTVPVQLAKK
jgi:hypothetical protein